MIIFSTTEFPPDDISSINSEQRYNEFITAIIQFYDGAFTRPDDRGLYLSKLQKETQKGDSVDTWMERVIFYAKKAFAADEIEEETVVAKMVASFLFTFGIYSMNPQCRSDLR